MDGFFSKIQKLKFKKNKKNFILIIGIVGILLIAMSSTFKKDKPTISNEVLSQTDEEYCNQLEKKVSELVTAITGDKKCIVAVTLENSNEYIYADQNKIDSDETEDKTGSDITTKQTHKTEQEYIIIEGENGEESALIVTEKKPSVRGVAIVSNGINELTKQHISEAVASMLGVADRKISITPKNSF